jgi:hypothetical protein
MEPFKKLLAYTFAVLFVLSAVFSLLFFNFERRAFRAETYQQTLVDGGFYDRIPSVLAEAMIASPLTNFQALPFTMQGMSTQDWESFFRTLLPQDALKLIGDDALIQTFNYLNMRSDSVTISFTPIKASMATDRGVQAVLALIRLQPACTLEQIAQMTIDLLNGRSIQFCNPPDEMTPLLIPVIQAQLQTTALVIPDQVTLITSQRGPTDPRTNIQTARTLMKLSPLFPIGVLLMLTLTAVNSLRSWLAWWGIPLLSIGFLSILISLIGAPLIGFILKLMLEQRGLSALPISFSIYAGDLASAMVSAILSPIFWEGLLLFLVGMGMISIYILPMAIQKLGFPTKTTS